MTTTTTTTTTRIGYTSPQNPYIYKGTDDYGDDNDGSDGDTIIVIRYDGRFQTWTIPKQKNVKHVIVDVNVKRIPIKAFSLYRRQLTVPPIPNRVLKSITIPDSVDAISPSAFNLCECLEEVTFQSSTCTTSNNPKLKTISVDAFRDCTSLSKIHIPSSVTKICINAFSGCSSLTTVIFGDEEENEENENNINNNNSKLREIQGRAFANCVSLTKISIPSTVKEIADSAFNNCQQLTKVKLHHGLLKNIPNGTFGGSKLLEPVTIPTSVQTITTRYNKCKFLDLPSGGDAVSDYGYFVKRFLFRLFGVVGSDNNIESMIHQNSFPSELEAYQGGNVDLRHIINTRFSSMAPVVFNDFDFYRTLCNKKGCKRVDIVSVNMNVIPHRRFGYWGLVGIQVVYRCTFKDYSTKEIRCHKHVFDEETEHDQRLIKHVELRIDQEHGEYEYLQGLRIQTDSGWRRRDHAYINGFTLVSNHQDIHDDHHDDQCCWHPYSMTLNGDNQTCRYQIIALTGITATLNVGEGQQRRRLVGLGYYAKPLPYWFVPSVRTLLMVRWRWWRTNHKNHNDNFEGHKSVGNKQDETTTDVVLVHLLDAPRDVFELVLKFL